MIGQIITLTYADGAEKRISRFGPGLYGMQTKEELEAKYNWLKTGAGENG